jgi:hypothetical protein
MSNEATKKWAEEQRRQEEARKRETAPKCLHCGGPTPFGQELCDACD